MTREKGVDKIFLGLTLTILTVGVFMFVSASLGVLAKNESKFYGVLFNQLALGLGGGLLAMYFASRIDYKFWRQYSFWILLGGIALTALVFIPGLSLRHGGAQRWLSLGFVSFQPAEALKIAFIIYFSAWVSWAKDKIKNPKYLAVPVMLLVIIAGLLLKQPDTKSLVLIVIAAAGIGFVAGFPWKYILGAAGAAIIGLIILVSFKPYLLDRLQTFVNPERDPRGSSFQLQQSLIAIGSGGVAGRGYGQSIQKFSYLPEPQGDSIFAVIGEEFGFVGGLAMVLLYLAFGMRGLRIAHYAPDQFSRLMTAGIVIIILAQSFWNIASLIGLFPLTGVPLVFVSHGGTSLLIMLAAVGIVLNISKYQKFT